MVDVLNVLDVVDLTIEVGIIRQEQAVDISAEAKDLRQAGITMLPRASISYEESRFATTITVVVVIMVAVTVDVTLSVIVSVDVDTSSVDVEVVIVVLTVSKLGDY